jgi:ABC-type uncharacterized transport system auxiliary subunit
MFWGAAMVFCVEACALSSKADLVLIRYYSPERPDSSAANGATVPNLGLNLRMGRVTSGSNLRERIAYRNAEYELGYYENLRWTERPEAYVRRQLERSLFETHGIHRVLGGQAPTLEVELIAFDDVQLKTGRAARVQLRTILYEGNNVILEYALSVDHPMAADPPSIEEVIAAMATALGSATEQVAWKVQQTLQAEQSAVPRDGGR